MSATLRLVREGFGIELRRAPFDVIVDGVKAASLKTSETIEVPVEPGLHTLLITSGRYSSRSEAFDVADGEVAIFQCHSAMVWPRWVASLLIPKLGIALRRH